MTASTVCWEPDALAAAAAAAGALDESVAPLEICAAFARACLVASGIDSDCLPAMRALFLGGPDAESADSTASHFSLLPTKDLDIFCKVTDQKSCRFEPASFQSPSLQEICPHARKHESLQKRSQTCRSALTGIPKAKPKASNQDAGLGKRDKHSEIRVGRKNLW